MPTKSLVKIDSPQGAVYLGAGDVISTIAMWFKPEHKLLLKAFSLEELPLILMPVSRSPHYFSNKEEALKAIDDLGREIQLIRDWAISGKKDLFSYLEGVIIDSLTPISIPAMVESIEVPEGYEAEGETASRWYVATYYEDQGFLFLEDKEGPQPTWIKSASEGRAWSTQTEEQALKKAKMITRTESLYAYPRFCSFS
jgi:hypothetical protein